MSASRPMSGNEISCQLRFPTAKSPDAFMNSVRARRNGLSRLAGTALSRVGFRPLAARPKCWAMNRGSRMVVLPLMGRTKGRLAQGPERLGDAEVRVACDAAGDGVGDVDREDGEDHRTAHDLEQRTVRPEEGARLNQRDPRARDARPETHDEIEQEHFDTDAEGV